MIDMYKVKRISIRIILLVACLFYSNAIKAYNFEVDGICYSYITNTNNVSVDYKWTDLGTVDSKYYSGDVVVPETVHYEGNTYNVVSIGYKAFSKSQNLKSVSLPNSIKNIGSSAFEDCQALVSVKMSDNVSSISQHAFKGCTSLNTIAFLPPNLTSIEYGLFEGCKGLVSIRIPDHITEIGPHSFGGCTNLETVHIPGSVKTIEYNAFYNCSKLSSLTISNGVEKIGSYSFYQTAISTLVIPESVTSIGAWAFYWAPLTLVKSEMQEPPMINEYCFDGETLQVPKGTKVLYEKTKYWKENFKEIIESGGPITYSLSIEALGNGSAIYNNTTIRNNTSSFTVNEGSSATISFSSDNGYRIKSVNVNNNTVSVSNNQYTISNISQDISLVVEFEKIPTYLSSVEIDGIYYNLDTNAKTAEVTHKENNYHSYSGYVNIPSSITYDGNTYIVNSIGEYCFSSCDISSVYIPTSVTNIAIGAFSMCDITSLVIPNSVTHISHSAFYGCRSLIIVTISENLVSLSANLFAECSSLSSVIIPNNIKEMGNGVFKNCSKLNTVNISTNMTSIGNYAFSGCESLSSVILPKGISHIGYGAFMDCHNLDSVKSLIETPFYIDDVFYRISSAAVLQVPKGTKSKYEALSSWADYFKEIVEYNDNPRLFTDNGIDYAIISYDNNTVNISGGDYGIFLEVPENVTYQGVIWKVGGVEKDVIDHNPDMAAIIWHPEAPFAGQVNNPNFLLYVNQAQYAPDNIKNVIVNGSANSITLTDDVVGNNFYCPKEFIAKEISYTHNYSMETGLGNARGWETIALPFDVQKVTHQSKGEIVPFANWKSGDAKKPFWLMTYGNSGWTEANSIKANTPYIISMPNHSYYKPEFQLNGIVTFSAENVTIPTSENINTKNYNGRTFLPNYINQTNDSYYALNVNNDIVTYSGNDVEGSMFLIGLRTIHPFEAYMTSASQARTYIAINEDMTTGIGDVTEIMADEKTVRVYNLNGQLIMFEENKSVDEVRSLLSAGVYIVNGKKLVIK